MESILVHRESKGDGREIAYLVCRHFERSLRDAPLSGARGQKVAIRVRAVLGSLREQLPFAGLQVTNHGETRIANVVKYDMGDGWRLVTQ